MKMKKMVGAFALTAALAMGTCPAFATAVGDEGEFAAGQASTDIKATVEDASTAQINATVPIQVAVVFGSEGNTNITAPSASAYQILNKSTEVDITLEEAVLNVPATSTFEFAPFYADDEDFLDGENASIIDATNGDNYIMLTMNINDGDLYTYLSGDHALSDALGMKIVGSGKNQQTVWNDALFNEEFTDFDVITIEKAVDEDHPTALGIKLGGMVYFNQAVATGEMTDTLCSITYTVKAVEGTPGA